MSKNLHEDLVAQPKAIKVLSIAHAAVLRGMARARYRPIATSRAFALTLVIPSQWREYGRTIQAETPEPDLNIKILRPILTDIGPAKWYLHIYPALIRLIRRDPPDVIHLWEEPWSLVALQAVLIRRAFSPNAAIILETDQNILRKLPPPFEAIRRFTLQRTDALIIRSAEAHAVALATGFEGPAVKVEYCIDKTAFYKGDRLKARAALSAVLSPVSDEALGENKSLVIGYVGRLVPEKGLMEVLAAMARCRSAVTLLLLGDGPEKEKLEAYAKQHGVKARFLPSRPYEEVADFLRSIDVLILFSKTTATWKEQFGRVIIEAQACGTPVIGSDSGSIPEVVENGGWIVKEGDSEQLAALLERLALHPEEATRKADIGLAQVAARFQPEKIAHDLASVYRIAIEQKRKKAGRA